MAKKQDASWEEQSGKFKGFDSAMFHLDRHNDDEAHEPVFQMEFTLEGKKLLAVRVSLAAPLLLIRGSKGFLGCGYFSLEALDKIGDAAAIVKGVKDFDQMLSAKVAVVSEKAKALGVAEGMSGKEALLLMA